MLDGLPDIEHGSAHGKLTGCGLYVHIPFCRKACHYCDFHFSTQLKYRDDMLDCLVRELDLRAASFSDLSLQSIYFGGGTPSVLHAEELNRLMEQIYRLFDVHKEAEITLEANPDDLTKEKLIQLNSLGVNRLSIGVQSFFDDHLKWMNRSHTASQALACIHHARESGFDSINADLIFAIPGMSMKQWRENIQRFVKLEIGHWSCYNLTIEEKTVLHNWVRKGKVQPVTDNLAADQYRLLMEMAAEAGMEHYEISNFCKPGKQSIHNANYWRGIPYLGIGPSAHSYNGTKRSWNIANNARYMKAVRAGDPFTQDEILSNADHYNEYVLTGLRTKWGCKIGHITSIGDLFARHFTAHMQPFEASGMVREEGGTFRLTDKGKLFADQIAGELFYVGESGAN